MKNYAIYNTYTKARLYLLRVTNLNQAAAELKAFLNQECLSLKVIHTSRGLVIYSTSVEGYILEEYNV